nr:MAG TPA: hypothetical protein [Caudoviricetes sp.]
MLRLFSFLNLYYLTLFDPISARLAQYLPNLNSAKCRNCDLCGALYVRFEAYKKAAQSRTLNRFIFYRNFVK